MRKETALHLSYDTRKLQALQYYLPQNGTSVEAAIIAHLDGIYDTQVPENVKEFLQHMGSEKTEAYRCNVSLCGILCTCKGC